MSNEPTSSKKSGTENDITVIHLFYIGGLLVEGMKNFHHDLITNCLFAPDVLTRATYIRMTELRDKFEAMAIQANDTNFTP
jgi:hypothetical protein